VSDTPTVTGATWRKRMQDLSRNVGRPHTPLFAPLILGAAAQIEAIPPEQMVRDATRLRKNVTELRRILGLQTAVCAVPSAMEVEAMGVAVSEEWPPRVVGSRSTLGDLDTDAIAASPRVAASLDATRQLALADTSEPVLIAALTGPATLLAQLRGAGVVVESEAGYEYVGRLLATLARLYAEAGTHVLQWHETAWPAEADLDWWKGALGTAGNVARFHRIPPLLVVRADECITWPSQAVACPTATQAAGSATSRAHGRAWYCDPHNWGALPGEGASERLITTDAEVPHSLEVAALATHAARVRRL
jgi:hypothetical protein